MHLFHALFSDAPLVVQILSMLQLGFAIWMAVDAYQRHAEPFWYWVILFFQPIGAWIYFFAVKFPTLRLGGRRTGFAKERRLPLDELRYRAERTPTLANRFALAERLMEKGLHAEAIPHLEAVLVIEPDYCAALHALAECLLATDAPEQAVVPLEKLLKRDHRWANYRAWRTLIDVHEARAQPPAALAACRELEKRMPTLENKCLLAEHLIDNRLPADAVKLLDQALEDYRYSAWNVRLRNWHSIRQARRLLATADKEETPGGDS